MQSAGIPGSEKVSVPGRERVTSQAEGAAPLSTVAGSAKPAVCLAQEGCCGVEGALSSPGDPRDTRLPSPSIHLLVPGAISAGALVQES